MKVVWWSGLLLFACILVVNAWIVDDAYITFRSVDNFLDGHGLRWNVDERVQSYTHPLWMLLIAAAALVTGEMFYSTLALSFVVSLAAVLVAARFVARDAPWKAPLLLLALLCSKAVIDYTSSGLETPLAYLIGAVFIAYMLGTASDERKLTTAVACAALSFLTRPDAVVLYLPAIAYLLARTRRFDRLAAGSLPAVAWVTFSLIYYGFPLPNTAYAKNLGAEFPADWLFRRGLEYAGNSLAWDAPSYAILAIAIGASLVHPTARAIMGGVVAYLVLVVTRLGSTTHMSGRHFAIPLFIAITVAIHLLKNRRVAAGMAAVLAVYFVWNPVSPVKFGTSAYVPHGQHWSYLDTKFFAYREGTALLNWWRSERPLPNHPWVRYGEQMRASPKRVFVGAGDPVWDGVPGVAPGTAIGFAGFAAGPEKFIIDVVALSDPLLARLPATRPETYDDWKSGHFYRTVPKGYVESVTHRVNLIEHPGIRQYYDALIAITRGPIWSMQRLRTIVEMNLGLYDHLLPQTATF
jgi:arabinofuranosyltransferase